MIIGITGKMGSGKSTLAQTLIQQGWEEYSFASPIKKIAEIFGFSEASLYTTQEEKLVLHPYWNVTSREFLQKFGTEVRREIEKIIPLKIRYGLWIDIFLSKYDKTKNYVIPDVRFCVEEELIRELGGKIVRTRKECVEGGAENATAFSAHPSETEMSNIRADLEIDNSALTKEQASESLLSFVSSL